MLGFRVFLQEIAIRSDAIGNVQPLIPNKISDLETHYTAPLTDTHSIAVMFNPAKHMPNNVIEVNWNFRGPGRFPEQSYTKDVHTRAMHLVGKAIEQHLAANPHINSVTGFAMTPGLDRSYARTLSNFTKDHPGSQYYKSETPFSAVFGTHQHTLVFK